MTWININDKLPNPGETVLVFTNDESDYEYIAPIRLGIIDDRNCWYNECLGEIEEHNITHWMPLPEPPNGMD